MYSARDLAMMGRLYARVKRCGVNSLLVNFRVLTRTCLDSWLCSRIHPLCFLNTCTTYTFSYLERKPITHLYLAIGQPEEDESTTNYFMCRTRFTRIAGTPLVSPKIRVRLPPNIQQRLLDHYTPFTTYRPSDV